MGFKGEIDQYCHLHLGVQGLKGWEDEGEREREGKENKYRRTSEQHSQ